MKNSSSLWVPFLLLSFLPAFGQEAAPPQYTPLKMHQTVAPDYPATLQMAGVAEGEVQVAIQVDASGRLTDTLVLAYTNGAFMRSAMDALQQWTFEPSKVDGEPRAATSTVTFDFRPNGMVLAEITGLSPNPMAAEIQRLHTYYEYQVSELRDLDRIPTPIRIFKPVLPPDAPKLSEPVHVAVSFYIDKDGRVRMPSVTRADDNPLGWAATAAVSQWRFSPPTVNGSPVVAHVSEDFFFRP